MIDLKFYITRAGATTLLQHSPVEWNKEKLNIDRSTTYWGLFNSYSIPLSFSHDGRAILQDEFYTKGIASDASLEVLYRDLETPDIFYKKCTGKFDFASVSPDDIAGETFNIVVIMSEIISTIKNNEITVYSIDVPFNELDPADFAKQLRFEGITENFETYRHTSDSNAANIPLTFPAGSGAYNLRIVMGSNNFKNINDGYVKPLETILDSYFIECLKSCKINIESTLGMRSYTLANMTFPYAQTGAVLVIVEKLVLLRGGVLSEVQQLTSSTSPVHQGDDDLTVNLQYYNTNIDVDFQVGDKIGVIVQVYLQSGELDFDFLYNCDTGAIDEKIKIYAPLPIRNLQCLTAKYIFSELARLIDNIPVKSDYLDNLSGADLTKKTLLFTTFNICHYWTPDDKQYFKTSFKEFFDYFASVDSVAIGIEVIAGVETLVFEPMEYFMNKSEDTFQLPNVNGLKVEMAKELIPNLIKFGFTNQTYGDDFGGKQECFGEHSIKTPQTVLVNEINWVSKYRMDFTGFDYLRKLYYDKYYTKDGNVKDDGTGDEIFVFDCDYKETLISVDYYELNREIVVTDPNFIHASDVYNLAYSPMRNLLRHGNYLISCLKFFETQYLLHTNIDKYRHLRSQAPGESEVAEYVDPLIGSLGTPFFVPFFATFNTFLTDEFEREYVNNPKLLPKFIHKDSEMPGYIFAASKLFAGLEESELKLLLSSQCDLTQFKDE